MTFFHHFSCLLGLWIIFFFQELIKQISKHVRIPTRIQHVKTVDLLFLFSSLDIASKLSVKMDWPKICCNMLSKCQYSNVFKFRETIVILQIAEKWSVSPTNLLHRVVWVFQPEVSCLKSGHDDLVFKSRFYIVLNKIL